jgi:NADH-quinone oxidoreductase subunit I
MMNVAKAIGGLIGSLAATLKHVAAPRDTVLYPEQKPDLPPRFRGRIVLTRDPDGAERCVACYLCSAVCPVSCIDIQSTEASADERRYPETFQINFARCIFCGLCEEACPTLAIQLTPDFEMCVRERKSLLYRKEDLLIEGPGKHPHYNFYRHSGVPIAGKPIGAAAHEAPPTDPSSNLP